MKLYCSANSPYARKVRVTVLELGLQDRVDLVETDPRDPTSGFWDLNPLGKIPALATDGGAVLYDSPVICEFLVENLGAGRLLADAPEDPWRVRTLVALADGTMDAGMAVRLERMRPENERSPAWIDKQLATVGRGLDRLQDWLEGRADAAEPEADLGTIAAGCCIAWVLFRHGEHDWLGPRPSLAAWHERFGARDAMKRTAPGTALSWTGV